MSRTQVLLRSAGAVLLLAGGALHTHLAFDDYGTRDLITSFFANGIASALVAAWIVADRRVLPVLAGIAVSLGSLGAFALSRIGDGILHFRGSGLDPNPDAPATLACEAAALVVLSLAVLAPRRRAAPPPR